ncbi:putative Late nodulin [Medicago truncatula]|uniref:Nodule Cysteine-Rich (NCR) secreted peptide n=1 Tax=Medicago truncatula TaxID=3880 RepID=A0A072VI49_MEDTR|nr:Nodule Cysteine-Rich (NCR) secreted peptide [Medicago truncatula]RHN79251.1 putative Late nodulin [Medicago truncatula]
MTETLKFVCVMFLFLSIFLVTIVTDCSSPIRVTDVSRPCTTDKDCSKVEYGYKLRCRKGRCVHIPR